MGIIGGALLTAGILTLLAGVVLRNRDARTAGFGLLVAALALVLVDAVLAVY